MKLLNTYDDREEAESAAQKITGEKRLASERDSTVVIYNLFGQPTWNNFYALGMFNLPLLKVILSNKQKGNGYEEEKHREIIAALQYVAKSFDLLIPEHWL